MLAPLIGLLASASIAAPAGTIVTVTEPTFAAGEPATVWITVRNDGDDGNDLIVEPLSVPSGWSLSPGWVQEPVPTGTLTTVSFTVTPPSSGGSGLFEWGLYYDVLGPWNDLLDTWKQTVVAHLPQPDLTVDAVWAEPAAPQVGHDVTFRATLGNHGTEAVSSFWCAGGNIPVRFTLDGNPLAPQQLSCGLDVGETDDESVTVVIDTPGPHTVRVVVDPDDTIAELDDTNNDRTLTLEIGWPALVVTEQLPTVGAPGLQDMPVGVTVKNTSAATIDDVYVALQLVGSTGLVDFGWAQGSNLSPGEEQTYEGEVDLGTSPEDVAFAPGQRVWRYQLFARGLPGTPGAFALSSPKEVPFQIVTTVHVTPDNIVVPDVAPVAGPLGADLEVTAHGVRTRDGLYDITLGFDAPTDFLAAPLASLLDHLETADVRRQDGSPECDEVARRYAILSLLLWRDMVVYHPWYQGTFVALQEGLAWYADETHLKIAYWITQPFVVLQDLVNALMAEGKGLAQWVGAQVGYGDESERLAGTLAFKVSMVLTKSYESARQATQSVTELSPLLAGEPYIASWILSERIFHAIETGGDDLDAAVDLVHEAMKAEAPDEYAGVAQVVSKDLILKAIRKTLIKGVKEVLLTAIKRGFTAYFIAQLTAETAWSVAVGEGSATLLAGLGAAGIAKGIASFGLTLIIDASIAYLSYVGTFLDNIRGSGGLTDAGMLVAQSVGWQHVLYTPNGAGGELDAAGVRHAFLAHAALVEVYGFVNSDLAMLKKLAFAKDQSKEYLAEADNLFSVADGQREVVGALAQATATLGSPACGPPVEEPPPDPIAPPRTRVEPAPPVDRGGQWRKPPAAETRTPPDPTGGTTTTTGGTDLGTGTGGAGDTGGGGTGGGPGSAPPGTDGGTGPIEAPGSPGSSASGCAAGSGGGGGREALPILLLLLLAAQTGRRRTRA